jgi:peptide/nickel transport system substrate-binding protein
VWLAGCGPEEQAAAPDARVVVPTEHPEPWPSGNVLRIQVDRLPRNLNPLANQDRLCQLIMMHNVFEPLVLPNASGGVRPHLAASIQRIRHGRIYRFTLRPNLHFHDGRPLTSADVKWTLERLIGDRSPSDLLKIELRDVLEVRTPAPDQVEIALRKANSMLLAVLAEVPILPAHIFSRRGLRNAKVNARPVGSGPFVVADREGQKTLVLQRNEDYWGQKARIGEVLFRAIPDPARALAALRNGELDIIATLYHGYYPDHVSDARLKRRFKLLRMYPYRMRVMIFNTRRSPLNDKRACLALIRLADRQRMVRTIRNGLGKVLSAPLWPMGTWYNRTIHPLSFNRKIAGRWLDAAGWRRRRGHGNRYRVGWPLKLTVLRARGSKESAKAAQILRQEWAAAGINVDLKVGHFNFVRSQMRRGRFDVALMGLAPRPGADLSPYLQTKGRLNYSGYSSRAVDGFLKSMRITTTARSRMPFGRRLHRMLHENPPMAVLYAPIEVTVASRRIGGLANNGRWPKLVTLWLKNGGK